MFTQEVIRRKIIVIEMPKLLITLLILLWCPVLSKAQSIRTDFGKNRVQYHDDFSKWWMYETENFVVYWYGKGRNVAQVSVQIAEYIHPDIQDIVEHRINDKIEIIVYTDLSDLLQSNIGNEETFETKNEVTKVIGSRMFVFFDGSHLNLRRRIREGVAHIYFNSMYSKKGLQEIVDSDPDLDIPDWYIKGFVSYAGAPWDYLMEDEMRDLWNLHVKRYRNFDKLARDHPRVAGHTLWHYLEVKYGRTSITTLLYLMRLRKDFDENIEFVFGFNFDRLKEDWFRFYNELFKQEEEAFEPFSDLQKINLGFKKYFPKSLLKLSPDGSRFVYAVNNQGRYHLEMLDLETRKKQTLFSYGSKNAVQQPDYNYPLVAWRPDGREITLCYENKDVITLRKIDLPTGQYVEQVVPELYQRIYSIDYLTDEEYLFSATTDAFSDLYIYKARNRQTERITNDFYDDLEASVANIGDQKGILFTSNRTTSTIAPVDLDTLLPLTLYDVFFLPLNGDVALNLTNSPDRNETQPRLVQNGFLTFLDARSGMMNRWVIDLKSRRRPYINSNYSRNIIIHDAVAGSGKYVLQAYYEGSYQTFLAQPNWNASSSIYYTSNASTINFTQDTRQLPEEPDPVDPGLLFESPFPDPPVVENLEKSAKFRISNRQYQPIPNEPADRKVIEFVSARAVASRRQFKLEDIITRVDNEVLFEGLETYTRDNREIEAQQSGLLVKGIVKDIFEDFEVEVGMRFPLNLKGSEFFSILDDKRERLDRRYALYRKQKTENILFNGEVREQRSTAFIALHRLSYPLNTYRSLRATGQLRIDNGFLLNTDPVTSEAERLNEQRMSLKLEYIFDNTLDIDLNLRHGARYKAYFEAINRFDVSSEGGFDLDLSRGYTLVAGFDARYYVPFMRNSVLAFRSAGATSFGSDKILYYVGGTDGWVVPKFNQEIPVPSDQNFAFKTIAPNLRGFNHNVRNGRSFLLGSAELRIPIFKYLSRKELRSKFLRNIQVVGFVDAGSAWHGFLPKKENNPLNTVIIDDAPGLSITLNLDRDNFIYGYGAGARLHFLGYFIRADYAWGVESGITGNPKLYISLGTDF